MVDSTVRNSVAVVDPAWPQRALAPLIGGGVEAVTSELGVARGLFSGSQPVVSYGELVTTGAVTDHLVWPLAGGALAIPPTAGIQPSLVSSSAQDGNGGTGIRSVYVHYLDGQLVQRVEVVVLAGLTPVAMVASDVRWIECMHLATVGSGKAAAGNISASAGGSTYSYISAGDRRCLSSARMVPAGKRLIVSGMFGGISSGTSAARGTLSFVATSINGYSFVSQGLTFPQMAISLQDSSSTLSRVAFPVEAGEVAGFEVSVDKAATVTAGLIGWFESLTA